MTTSSSRRRRLIRTIVTVALALGAVALSTASCSNSSTGDATPVFLVVVPDSVALFRFDSATLTVNALDRDSALLTGIAVTFRSSDTNTVRVTAVGLVRSVGPTGKASVFVTAGRVTRTVPVTVTGKPKSIAASPADTSIRQGTSYQLRTRVLDSLGDSVTNAPRAFFSGDTAVAVVSGTGLVTARKPGQTSLQVSSGNLLTFVSVTVLDSNAIARIPLANAPYGVAASRTGVVYVTQGLGSAVRRINMATFTLTDDIAVGANAIQVAFAGAGATALVTKRPSHSLGIIDVATHSQIDTIAIPGDPFPIRISASGSTAYVTSTAGWLYKVDIASRMRIDSVPAPDPSTQLTLGPGDSLAYFSSEFAGTVTEVRTATMTAVRTFPTGGTPQALAVSQDGAELYVADESGPLQIWSLASATRIDSVAAARNAFGVALTPDGTKLFVGTTTGKIYLVNRATRAIIHSISVGGNARNVAVDPVTGYAVVPNESGGWIDIVK
jgi:DNA-binding beta-propeller fold protein YncE